MEDQTLVILCLSLLVALLVILLLVFLIRWIFRINVIVDLLKQIAKKDVVFRCQSDLKNCTVCEKEYPAGELVKIDSGQLLCPQCHKMFENKKGEKV